MSTTETLTPNPTPEPTVEEQLTTLLNPPEVKEVSVPSGDTGSPEPASPETPAQPSELEQKLAEIPDAPEVKEEPKSELSDIQQQILAAFPNPENAKQVVQQSDYFGQLNNALQSHDYDTVEQMFAPEALEGFLEHIYQKKVTSGEWVDRWISDKEGNPAVTKGMSALERKVAQLEAKLQEKDQSSQLDNQKAERARLNKSYHDHLTSLYEKINFSEGDREYVTATVTARVSKDPALMAAYNSGNMSALNKVWKETVTAYSQKDRAQNQKTAEVLQAQEKKKPLIQGQAATFSQELPSDIRQVPADKVGEWQTQELAKLFRK